MRPWLERQQGRFPRVAGTFTGSWSIGAIIGVKLRDG